MVKETSSKAFTTPPRVKKYVLRLFTSSRFSVIAVTPLTNLLIEDRRRRASHHPGRRMPALKWPARQWAAGFQRDENQLHFAPGKSAARYWSLVSDAQCPEADCRLAL